MLTDEEIHKLCLEGDNVGRRLLYERYASRLYAVCLRFASSREEAEDWLHDIFLHIYQSVGRFEYKGEGSLPAWMQMVGRNHILQQIRKAAQWQEKIPLDETMAEPDEPMQEDIQRIDMELLTRFIQELPPGYRAVFNLYVIEGHSHREIGELLGIRERTSSSQFYRARQLLARRINQWRKEAGQ